MTNNLTKMTTLEAVCLILILTINRIILNMPQNIIKLCASASILNIIYISIITIIFALIIVKLYNKFPTYDILDISKYIGGNTFKNIIGIILSVYFILVASASIRNFSEILYVTYYDRAYISYILLFFVLTCGVCNFIGEQTIIRTNVVLTIVMLFSLFITFFSVTPSFVIQRIYPILGYGTYKTFYSGLTNILAFNGLIALYCLRPMVSEKNADFKKITIISGVLICLLILFATVALLLSLAYNTEIDDISPVYTLISNNKLGNFIQHPESLFVFTWMLSLLSYLNIAVMFIIRFSKKISGLNNSNLFTIPLCIIIYIIALIPKNLSETHNIEIFLYRYMLFPLVFVIFPTILIIANIKYKKKNSKNTNGGKSL